MLKKIGKFVLWLIILLGIAVFFLLSRVPVKNPGVFGVTFSPRFAKSFGQDPKKTFAGILGDLGARRIRLGIYWDKSEPKEGVYDFGDTDFYLAEAEKRGAKIILAVGAAKG